MPSTCCLSYAIAPIIFYWSALTSPEGNALILSASSLILSSSNGNIFSSSFLNLMIFWSFCTIDSSTFFLMIYNEFYNSDIFYLWASVILILYSSIKAVSCKISLVFWEICSNPFIIIDTSSVNCTNYSTELGGKLIFYNKSWILALCVQADLRF